MAPINVRMETGDRFELNWDPHGEILIAPFELSPGANMIRSIAATDARLR